MSRDRSPSSPPAPRPKPSETEHAATWMCYASPPPHPHQNPTSLPLCSADPDSFTTLPFFDHHGHHCLRSFAFMPDRARCSPGAAATRSCAAAALRGTAVPRFTSRCSASLAVSLLPSLTGPTGLRPIPPLHRTSPHRTFPLYPTPPPLYPGVPVSAMNGPKWAH